MLRRSRSAAEEASREGLGSALDADLKQDGCRPPDGREYSTGQRRVQSLSSRGAEPPDRLEQTGVTGQPGRASAP